MSPTAMMLDQNDGNPLPDSPSHEDDQTYADNISNDEAHSKNGDDTNATQPEDMQEDTPVGQNKKTLLQVVIQRVPTGITTFGYERVLRNYIRSSMLLAGCPYDPRTYTPVFVHDCLMFPGSLANLIGKSSSHEVINRMTPALLPGYHPHVHHSTQLPYLVPSTNPNAYVQGVLIFGQNPKSRELINKHYGSKSKRIRTKVQVDLLVQDDFSGSYKVERRRVRAAVWICADDEVAGDDLIWGPGPRWRIEKYLSESVAGGIHLRVAQEGTGDNYEEQSTGDEDTEVARDEVMEQDEEMGDGESTPQASVGIATERNQDKLW